MVRTLPTVLAISAAVHAAALAWFAAYTPERPPEIVDAPAPAIIELAEPVLPVLPVLPPVADVPPVDIAFLDDATTANVPALPDPVPVPVPRGRERAPTAAGAAISVGPSPTEVAAATGPVVRNRYLDMRRPGAPRVQLPKLEWNPDMPAEAPPPADETTGQLAPSGNGTHESDQGPFIAKVARDGTVKIKDKQNFHIHIALPSPKQLGRMVGDWYMDPNKPVGFLPPDHIEKAPVLDSGENGGSGKKPDHGEVSTVPIVAGGFDVTDALMRGQGIDPYASKKLKFLDSTRAERVQIGKRHRTEQLAMAPEIMKRNLDRLWARVADPAVRREALFELWDECAETGTEELVSAGQAARKLVDGFILARLPAGSPDAFTPAELTAFNRRRSSTAVFAPY